MRIKIVSTPLADCRCDLLAVGVFEGVRKPSGAAAVVPGGLIADLIRKGEITGELGKTTIIHTQGKLPAERVAIAGLGKEEEFGAEEARIASAATMRSAKEVRAGKVALSFDWSKTAVRAAVEGAVLGQYEFEGYGTEKSEIRNPKPEIKELIILLGRSKEKEKFIKDIKVGEAVAEAQNRARDLVNAPSNKITPSYLANYARQTAKRAGLKCEILDPRKEGMELLWSVAKGSEAPAKVVVLKYRGSRVKGQEMVALIGKGITFDSGGISLKPSKKMDEMKTDMAGAAAVIEVMGLLRKLKISKKVIAVVPLCENMPSGRASKPGDVADSLSGKTVEIISTDAEGRMILADAITYAKKSGADKIIDVATLTGGCVVALGDVASGVMSNDKDFLDQVLKAAGATGEKMWELPLYKEYKEYLKSRIADIKNCADNGKASASTGGIFLQLFVEDTPWVHIDIAGTAHLDKGRGYLAEGATGAPMRTLIEFLMTDS